MKTSKAQAQVTQQDAAITGLQKDPMKTKVHRVWVESPEATLYI
ncbi:MAG: hypothetical protein VW579_03730 [Verrucomicrobiales bacterium]